MGFRFRKSLKIAPGVKLNLNKKSAGITFGGKGFHYTMNSKGKRTTSMGIPGTGLSYTSSSGGKSSSKRNKTSNSKSTNNNYIADTENQYNSNISAGSENRGDSSMKDKKSKKGCLPIIIVVLLLIIGIGSCGGDDDEAENKTTTVTSATGIKGFELAYDSETVTLDVGETEHSYNSYFSVKGTEDFSIDDIKLVSSDESVATFTYDRTSTTDDIYYNIEAVGAGTATLYVQTVDGIVKSEEITVTVTNGVDAIRFYDESISINIGETHESHVSIDGTMPNDEFIKFVSSDESIVTIEHDEETSYFTIGFKVTGVSEGTATIYAETEDGFIRSEEITVTVEKETTTEKTTERETKKSSGRMVYVAPNGERYHYDSDCAGKNGYQVSIDNVGGRTACKKCAQ